jgi:hypothetical protein
LLLFFVVTGLSLNIGALSGTGAAILALVGVIATIGKLGPGLRGVPDQRLFSNLVVMALLTTALTTPLLALIQSPAAALPDPELAPAALPPRGSGGL